MIVKFKIRGPIADRLGKAILEADIEEGSSLGEGLVHFISKSQEVHREWNTPEEMDRTTLLLINERDIELLQGLDTVLNEGDTVTILPLIHGG